MPPHFEELEPRVLYSADLAPQADIPPVETVEQVVEDQTEPDSQTSLAEDKILYLDESGSPTYDSTQNPEASQRLEIVFIDSSISEYQTLLDGLQSTSDTQIQHFVLDRNVDGFEQLQFALESLENISAIHLISHGDDASFQLGQDSINSDNVDNYQASFSTLAEKLRPDADLLIYGCNIAESADGQQLLGKLSTWTGADVAGSTDLTGHQSLGGDWELEYQQGHIETSVVVSSASQLSWNYALDTVSGLVGHWTLDNDSNDSTSNSYNGTLTGNAAIDTAAPTNQIGTGKLTLDGSGDYVDLSAHSGGIGSLSNGTVSLWVNFTANGLLTAFNVSDTGSGDNYAVLGFDNGTPYFKVKDTATLLEVDAVNSINDGNWHHVAITVDGSGNKLYVDGVQATGGNLNYATGNASTSAFFGDVSSVDAIQIGINEYNSGFSWDFNGLIDDVRVFNRALSASDIGELVAAATPLHSIEVSTTSDVSDGDTSSLAALNAYKGADGEISLREAIQAANNTANIDGSTPDEIHFNISDPLVNGAHTISLTVALPDITDAVIIDGTTDPDFSSSPVIQIDDAGTVAHGLKVTGDGSTIKSLAVTGFNEGGITLNSNNNLVVGNYVGLNPDGSLDGNSQKHGILVGGSNNTIGGTTAADRNYIVDHTYAGITLNGGSADNNHVMGNYIGVMPDGSTLAANNNFSIYTANGANNNIIGTDGDGNSDANEGNVIAGSNLNFGGSGASGTIIAGNKIGTDATGTVRLGGTVTINGDSNARIGTDNDGTSDALEANIIATKITVSSNASVAVIAGNYIGVQSDGTTSFGSTNGGIIVNSDAVVTVGGTSTTEANVIAHNGGDGVQINSTGATVSVLGNSIFGNTGSGIDILNDGPNQNDPEDADTGTNNLLNFPVLTNVVQNGANLDIDFVIDLPAGNYRIEFFDNPAGLDGSGYGEGQQFIGFVNITTTGALGTESFSTTLNSVTASDVTNIATTATESNGGFVTFGATSEFGPQFDGQHVVTVTTTSDVADGDTSSITALLGNRGGDGKISLREAMEAADNTANINASTPDQIHFDIATTDANYASGTNSWLIQLGSMLPHIDEEVVIDATTQTAYDGTPSIELDGSLIGGGSDSGFITDTDDVVIRGFAINDFSGYGIHLSGSGGHIIESNYIGTDITGTIANGNGVGIYVGSGADNTTIGSSGMGNLISGNTSQGIYVTGSSSVEIKSNLIGTDITGSLDLGNGSSGIRLQSADSNTIGGTTAAERNLISGNDTRGIYISDSDNNTVQGNYIGTNAAGSAAIGNINAGVRISGVSIGNTIGGTVAGAFNVISGNADGIYIQDIGTTGNTVQGNYIGTDATGLLDVGNLDRGVQLENNTSTNTIGGTTAAERNIISGNDTDGIIISNGANNNLIQGNYIGLGVDGTTAVGNGTNGVRITDPNENLIGGSTTGAGNRIANNSTHGVVISTGTGISILGNEIFSNGGQAIDLGFDGLTVNDSDDPDTGANDKLNYPQLSTPTLSGTDLTISGKFNSDQANTQFRIEFFGIASADADASNGEARYYLGSTNLTTDASGDGGFTNIVLSGVTTLGNGDLVTATATQIDAFASIGVNDLAAFGNTSELSANATITAPNSAPTDISPNGFTIDEYINTSAGINLGTLSTTDSDVGDSFTYSIVGGADQAKFSIGGAGSDELIFTDGILDFEVQSSYSVTIRTTDSGSATYDETLTITVNDLNDAPTISNGFGVGLPGADEDSITAGTTVSAIVNNASWADEDAGAVRGMAITSTAGNGSWQYSTDAVTWTDFGSVSSGNALLLSASSQVRYVGDGENGEIASFNFRAWDSTAGSASINGTPAYANPGTGGAATAYSSEVATASSTITSVNDAPIYSPADGIVSTDIGASNDGGEGLVIQPDGKIVVGGHSLVGGAYHFSLARYNVDGSLDTSFGSGNGFVSSPFGTMAMGLDIALQPDGKFLVAGISNLDTTFDFTLARYNADGSLDTSFGGGDGVTTTTLDVNVSLSYSVIVQSDGNILLSGSSHNGTDYDFSIARFLSDGTLDTSFGAGNGYVTTAIGANTEQPYSIAVQTDGKILLGGLGFNGATNDFALVRYNSDGSLDTSFGGGDGIVLTDVLGDNDAAFDFALQPDGKILLTGSAKNGTYNDVALLRYNTDGSLDTSFGGGDGIVTTNVGIRNDLGENVVVQSDGRIVVVGSSNNGSNDDIIVMRYLSDGTQDTSFSGSGIVSIAVGNAADQGKTVALQSDGKIVVTGNAHTGANSDYVVLRLNTDGTLDTSFGDHALNAISAYTEDGPTVPLDHDISIIDVELDVLNAANGNYAGASLELARSGGPNAEDIFSFNDANGISLSGGNLIKNSQIIASFDTSSIAGELTLVFTDANGEIPTSTDIDHILQQITYANSSDNPPTSVQIDWLFNDGNVATQGTGGALTAAGSSTVLITASNDAPVVTPAQSFSVSELAANGASVGTVLGSDVDLATTLQNWSITSGNSDGIFAINSTTGEITIADNSNLDFDSTTSYMLGVTVSDASDTSAVEVVTIQIDDAATSIPVGQSFSISESAADGTAVGTVLTSGDSPKTFSITAGNIGMAFAIDNLGAITVADTSVVDFETLASYTLTIEVSDGTNVADETVTINITDASEIAPVILDHSTQLPENANDGVILHDFNDQLSGTDLDTENEAISYSLISGNEQNIFAINSATGIVTLLNSDSLDYETNQTYSLGIEASDGSYSSTAQLTIQITNINEAPIISAPNDLSTDEDVSLAIGSVQISDPDSGSQDIEVTLTASNGVFSLGDTGNLSSVPVSDALDQFVLRGSANAINQALAGLVFIPNENYNGLANLTVVANDLGQSGVGSALSVAETLTITIIPVNDEPALDVPDNLEVLPGESIEFSTALDNLAPLQDLDSQSTNHQLSLSIKHAQLSLSQDELLAYVDVDTGSELWASGDLATINRILNALVITPDSNYFGELTLDLYLQDEGGVSVGETRSLNTQINLFVPAPILPIEDTPSETADPEEKQSESESDQLLMVDLEAPVARDKSTLQQSSEEASVVAPIEVDFTLQAEGEAASTVSLEIDDENHQEQQQIFLSSSKIFSNYQPLAFKGLLDFQLDQSGTNEGFTPSLQGFEQMFGEQEASHNVSLGVRIAEISGAGFVVGSVVWLLKGSSLLSSLLVSYPAWRGMDPLPVLVSHSNAENKAANSKKQISESPKNTRFNLLEEDKRKL